MKEQAKKGAAYMYRDYSDAELKLLIDHYKTPSAQKETDAMMDGTTEYMGAVMSQMMEVMKKKRGEGKKKVIELKKKMVCNELEMYNNALILFKVENKFMLPTTEEGLEALLKNPDSKKYPHYSKQSYLQKITLDPWGSKFIYRNNNGKIELLSYGADKKAGGENENRDISRSECK